MGERSFQPLAALPQQAFAARATNPPAIPIDGLTRLRILRPVAATTVDETLPCESPPTVLRDDLRHYLNLSGIALALWNHQSRLTTMVNAT